jgi:MFS superfamily sulfate permease-like transporter
VSDLTSNLTFPNFELIQTQKFWIIVFTIAIVASLETLLNIEAVDKINPEKTDTNSNRELIAQGLGNMTSGFVGGLPVTSVIVRSSANINAGAKSKWSTILHALFLLISVLLIPNVLTLIPNASLAAILIFTGYKLTTYKLFKGIWNLGLEQFIPFVITIIVMLFTDLLKGVGVGICLSTIYILRDNITASFDTNSNIIQGKRHYLIKLPRHVSFFNKGFLIRFFDSVESDSIVIIDGSTNNKINIDAKEVILDFIESANQKNIQVEIIKLKL